MKLFASFLASLTLLNTNTGAAPTPAALAVNSFGLELHRLESAAHPGNLLHSPYSIAMALCLAREGAAGTTRLELERVLHAGPKPDQTLTELAKFRSALDRAAANSVKAAEKLKFLDGLYQPMQYRLANRIFVSEDFSVRPSFKELLQSRWNAVPESLPFSTKPDDALTHINGWVAEQTSRRIVDLLSPGSIDEDTKLLLVNALFLKASWQRVCR